MPITNIPKQFIDNLMDTRKQTIKQFKEELISEEDCNRVIKNIDRVIQIMEKEYE